MNQLIVANYKLKEWTILIDECRSEDGSLYDREFKIVSTDDQGVPMVEYFHSLIEAIEFALDVEGDDTSPWAIAEKMAADAKTFYWRRSNARA